MDILSWRGVPVMDLLSDLDTAASWLTPGECSMYAAITLPVDKTIEVTDRYTLSLLLALDSVEKFSKGLTSITTVKLGTDNTLIRGRVLFACGNYRGSGYARCFIPQPPDME